MTNIFKLNWIAFLIIAFNFVGCGESEAEREAVFQKEMSKIDNELKKDFDHFKAISSGLKNLYDQLKKDAVPEFSVKARADEKSRAHLLMQFEHSPLSAELYATYDASREPNCRKSSNTIVINDTDMKFSKLPTYPEFLSTLFTGERTAIPMLLDRMETGKWKQVPEEDRHSIRDPERIGGMEALLLTRIRYALLAKTMYYQEPTEVGEESFKSGKFGQRFFLYDLVENKMIGSFYLFVESSPEVSFLTSEQWQGDDTFKHSAKTDLYDNMTEKLQHTLGFALEP